MSLRLKLLLLFVMLIIIPLTIAGLFSFQKTKEELIKEAAKKLVAVADVQKQRTNEVLDRYSQEVSSVASQVQLWLNMAESKKNIRIKDSQVAVKILKDIKNLTPAIDSVSIYDQDGAVFASTEDNATGQLSVLSEDMRSAQTVGFVDVFKNADNSLRMRLFEPFIFTGGKVGIIEVVMKAASLVAVTADYTGLEKTGEVSIVKKNKDGNVVFLTPLRFSARAAMSRVISQSKTNDPAVIAISGKEDIFIGDGMIDYRMEPVFAVTRFIDSLGWGLVVKIDQAEVLAPANAILATFLTIIIIVAFVALILSYLLSHIITRPITELSSIASRLANGDFSVQASGRSKDEIGTLGRSFNGMVSKLKDSYATLEQKVRNRTQDLEQARAKDDAILSSIGDGLVVTDQNERILFVNNAFEKNLGWASNDVLGKLLSDVISMVDADDKIISESERLVTKIFKEHSLSAMTNTAICYKRKDGTSFPVAITVAPIFVSGELIGAVEVFRDITKEKEIDKAKTEFVSLASHQLRTPLSTVNWYIEMLLSGDAGQISEEQKTYLKEIYHGSQRMVELVNALLNVSRLGLGTFVFEPEQVNIIELAQNVVGEQMPQINEKKMQVKIDVMKNIPLMYIDPRLLRMVLQNLLSNAIKYTPEGGSIITTINTQEAGQYCGEKQFATESLCISIADTGYGISENQHDKVFSKLFRADNIKDKDTDGTGLGLYIVKSIVEQFGGEIWFTSQENKGTTFHVVLPFSGTQKEEN